MKSQQGQIQIQFNWIFVIIVGSVLLVFFFMLIRNQSDTTEERIDITQSKYFQTVISATGQKSGTLKEYKVKDLSVRFTCNRQTQEYTYSVEDLPSRDTTYEVIFSPELLAGEDIQTWTQDWQVPFSAGNFLYLTNSRHAYVFVQSQSSDYEDLIKDFPKNISVEIINSTNTFDDVNRRNYERITYVFLYEEEPTNPTLLSTALTPLDAEKNKVILIRKSDEANTLFDVGQIYFLRPSQYNNYLNNQNRELWYNNQDTSRISSYLGKASLYGAIFSENKEMYECNMEKAFTKLELITELYYHRIENLVASDDLTNLCKEALQGPANSAASHLFPYTRLQLLKADVEDGFSSQSVELAYDHLEQLQDNNRIILGIANCPPLY